MSRAPVTFREVPFSSTAAAQLVAEVQAEYVARYGGPDETPVAEEEFSSPRGIFIIGFVSENGGSVDGGVPVACAGVRMVAEGVAELKRMYVRPQARRRGIARQLLVRVEAEAVRLGATSLRLETGVAQPEAIALYQSAGYRDAEPFGHYACQPGSRHLAKALAGQEPEPATTFDQ